MRDSQASNIPVFTTRFPELNLTRPVLWISQAQLLKRLSQRAAEIAVVGLALLLIWPLLLALCLGICVSGLAWEMWRTLSAKEEVSNGRTRETVHT